MASILTRPVANLPNPFANIPPIVARLLRKLHLIPALGPTPLQPTDNLWLSDNYAFPNAASPSGWTAEFTAAFFIANSCKDLASVVASIAATLEMSEDEVAQSLIEERVQPFLDVILEGRTVEVDFGATALSLGPSGSGGTSTDLVNVAGMFENNQVVRARARLPSGFGTAHAEADMETRFVGNDGWAVISGKRPGARARGRR